MRSALLLVALAPFAAQAQDVEQTNLRYDEDWSLGQRAHDPHGGHRGDAQILKIDHPREFSVIAAQRDKLFEQPGRCRTRR